MGLLRKRSERLLLRPLHAEVLMLERVHLVHLAAGAEATSHGDLAGRLAPQAEHHEPLVRGAVWMRGASLALAMLVLGRGQSSPSEYGSDHRLD